jgi:hypothetical protein
MMPKGAVHHLHTTGAAPIDSLIKQTYKDFMYYSEKENMFKAFPNEEPDKGYELINTLRTKSGDVAKFDEGLKQKILLENKAVLSGESNVVWDHFEYKFILTFG